MNMYIYQWKSVAGLAQFIIADLIGSGADQKYTAPLSRAGREATGKPALIAATLDELGASPHVRKFRTFKAAKRALPAARAVKLD